MTFLSQPYLLHNKIQNYAWGEKGEEAYIARLLGLQDVQPGQPFAELWMGTHPLGTSELDYEERRLPLSELVARYPAEVLGQRVAAAFGNQFPFLLKILSADEPLSIQVHPSKEQAVLLHQRDPEHYPDDNHKPEIAIALEQLQALAGLRPAAQVQDLLREHPELRDFVGFDGFAARPQAEHPRLAFLGMLRGALDAPEALTRLTAHLAEKLRRQAGAGYRENLFLEMSEKYPGDVGLLSILLLELHSLQKGQALFLPAGVPHAYLKGNIVECMASSDNVIRAGLTPKFKDIPALLEVVTDQAPILYAPTTADYIYSVPVGEFRVGRARLEGGAALRDVSREVRILLLLGGRLRLAWQGGSLELARGQSVLLPGNLNEVGIECLEAAELYTADVP